MLKKPDQNKKFTKTLFLYVFFCCLILSFPACNNDNDEYKEVSKLISSRNSARYQQNQKNTEKKQKKPGPKKKEIKVNGNENKETETEKTKFSTEIFYEEEIKIISTFSDETLGVGTAYLNKDGKIVQIKIKRD